LTGTDGGTGNCCVEVFLNGINQGTPLGTAAFATATNASVSVVVNCTPGDLVIAGFSTSSTITVSGRGGGQTNLADIQNGAVSHLTVDSAIATGSTITFTWTLSGSIFWSAGGVAVKSA
jgi:hypothetical protein